MEFFIVVGAKSVGEETRKFSNVSKYTQSYFNLKTWKFKQKEHASSILLSLNIEFIVCNKFLQRNPITVNCSNTPFIKFIHKPLDILNCKPRNVSINTKIFNMSNV